MPGSITPPSRADLQDFLRCNQFLTQYTDTSSNWTLCGLRWSLQRFHYCCPLESVYGVPVHQHDYFEINLLCRGRVRFYTPRHEVRVGPGEVYFMPAKRKHSWEILKAPVTIAGFHIRVSAVSPCGQPLLDALNERAERGEFKLRRRSTHTKIHQSIWELLHQCPPGPLTAEKLCTLVQLFMEEFMEQAVPASLTSTRLTTPTIGPDTIASSKYQQVVSFVHENINRPIRLEDVAQHFNYSVRHVARLFRRESGVALGQYIMEQKLRTAQRLLATTDSSVKTIAIDLGFHDVGYFCRLFRTHLMGTPNSYRTEILAGRSSSPDSRGGCNHYRGFFRSGSQDQSSCPRLSA